MTRMTQIVLVIMVITQPTAWSQSKSRSKILPPGSPETKPPAIQNDTGAFDNLLKRSKKRRKKRLKEMQYKMPSLDDRLKAEAEKPHPMQLHISATPVYPFMTTSGERKDYQAEPSTLFHLQFRFDSSPLEKNKNFWMGFRFAPFTGTGVYKQAAGRFGFLYYGPMLGVGSFNPLRKPKPGQKKLPERADGKAIKTEKADYSRSGYFWTSGIAVQWRASVRDEGSGLPEDDFNNLGAAFDSPGLWSEFHYITSKYDLYSINYLIGVQLGKGKTFAYFGAGVGLWY